MPPEDGESDEDSSSECSEETDGEDEEQDVWVLEGLFQKYARTMSRRDEGELWERVARAACNKGAFEKGMQAVDEAVKVWKEYGDLEEEGRVTYLRGLLLDGEGSHMAAAKAFRHAQALWGEAGKEKERLSVQAAYNSAASELKAGGEEAAVETALRQALLAARKACLTDLELLCLCLSALQHMANGMWSLAAADFTLAVECSAALDKKMGKGQSGEEQCGEEGTSSRSSSSEEGESSPSGDTDVSHGSRSSESSSSGVSSSSSGSSSSSVSSSSSGSSSSSVSSSQGPGSSLDSSPFSKSAPLPPCAVPLAGRISMHASFGVCLIQTGMLSRAAAQFELSLSAVEELEGLSEARRRREGKLVNPPGGVRREVKAIALYHCGEAHRLNGSLDLAVRRLLEASEEIKACHEQGGEQGGKQGGKLGGHWAVVAAEVANSLALCLLDMTAPLGLEGVQGQPRGAEDEGARRKGGREEADVGKAREQLLQRAWAAVGDKAVGDTAAPGETRAALALRLTMSLWAVMGEEVLHPLQRVSAHSLRGMLSLLLGRGDAALKSLDKAERVREAYTKDTLQTLRKAELSANLSSSHSQDSVTHANAHALTHLSANSGPSTTAAPFVIIGCGSEGGRDGLEAFSLLLLEANSALYRGVARRGGVGLGAIFAAGSIGGEAAGAAAGGDTGGDKASAAAAKKAVAQGWKEAAVLHGKQLGVANKLVEGVPLPGAEAGAGAGEAAGEGKDEGEGGARMHLSAKEVSALSHAREVSAARAASLAHCHSGAVSLTSGQMGATRQALNKLRDHSKACSGQPLAMATAERSSAALSEACGDWGGALVHLHAFLARAKEAGDGALQVDACRAIASAYSALLAKDSKDRAKAGAVEGSGSGPAGEESASASEAGGGPQGPAQGTAQGSAAEETEAARALGLSLLGGMSEEQVQAMEAEDRSFLLKVAAARAHIFADRYKEGVMAGLAGTLIGA